MANFKKKCLIVDDDPIVLDFFNFALEHTAEFVYLESGKDVMKTLQKHSFDIAFIDLGLPDISGHDVIREITNYNPDLPIVVISSTDSIQDAITAFRLGAMDFLTKPIDDSLLKRVFKKCLHQHDLVSNHALMKDKVKELSNQLIMGNNEKVKELKEDIQRLKGSEMDTLIVAESGCGKELVAKSLNQQEGDANRPYVTLNCSAIPKDLMESILFGHVKGAFTGADKNQTGKFELANNGDIFLDEIGTLPLDLQAKLLRVLQEREIEPVGAGLTKKIQFRVIAATNEDMVQMVKNGTFRKDLYFRLNKIILKIPPLRERTDDIPLLVKHFLKKKARNGVEKTIADDALKYMMNYSWPGNVRELENTIENLMFTARGTTITLSDMERLSLERDPFMEDEKPNTPTQIGGLLTSEIKNKAKAIGLYETVDMLKMEIMKSVTEENQGKVNKTIQDLKISTNTYYKLMKGE